MKGTLDLELYRLEVRSAPTPGPNKRIGQIQTFPWQTCTTQRWYQALHQSWNKHDDIIILRSETVFHLANPQQQNKRTWLYLYIPWLCLFILFYLNSHFVLHLQPKTTRRMITKPDSKKSPTDFRSYFFTKPLLQLPSPPKTRQMLVLYQLPP